MTGTYDTKMTSVSADDDDDDDGYNSMMVG